MNRTEPPLPQMTGRRQLRLFAVAALVRAAPIAQGMPVTILSPGDWNIPADRLPAIVVRTGRETKTSFNRGMPEFTTECALEVKAAVIAPTAERAQDAIEALWFDIETALLGDYWLIRMIQQFERIETSLDISAEGAGHIAGIEGTFSGEFPETYDPTAPPAVPDPLESIGIHVDTLSPADPLGTYPDPQFPDAVTPAPRTRGPDGRDEGTLDIPLQDPPDGQD